MADRLGVLPHIVEAILNHVSGHRAGVAGVYNRARYAAEMREALQRWAQHVAALPVQRAGRADTVLALASPTGPLEPIPRSRGARHRLAKTALGIDARRAKHGQPLHVESQLSVRRPLLGSVPRSPFGDTAFQSR